MDDVIYLNHAGTSWPKPIAIREACRDAMETDPSEWPARFQAAHESICQSFGVSRAENLLLTPGCTASLHVAITNAQVPADSRVLTSCWEHHAVEAPLLSLTERGVTVTKIPPSASGVGVDLNRLEAELVAGGVSLVAVTAACNVTGDLLPVNEIIELSHRFDAQVLIDAAQIVGWVDVNLDDLGADFVAFGGHKALQGPCGIGALYVSPAARLSCNMTLCSLPVEGANHLPESEGGGQQRLGYCDVGTVNQPALAGFQVALNSRGESPRESNLANARHQIARIAVALEDTPGVRIFGSFSLVNRLPTIAFTKSRIRSSTLAEQLRQQGLIVGHGLLCSPSSNHMLGTESTGVIRVSVGVSQSDAAIDEAIARLKAILSGSARA